MAITVPLTGTAAGAVNGVSTLLVLGVDSELDPLRAAGDLDHLLAIHARTDVRSVISLQSDGSCRATNARADSIVSPVTYGRGHDSPYPTAPRLEIASTQTLDVSERSAAACRNATLNGIRTSFTRSSRSWNRSDIAYGVTNASTGSATSFAY